MPRQIANSTLSLSIIDRANQISKSLKNNTYLLSNINDTPKLWNNIGRDDITSYNFGDNTRVIDLKNETSNFSLPNGVFRGYVDMEGINETVRYYLEANDTFSWNAYGPNNSWRIYGAHSECSGYLVRGSG